MHSLQP